MSQRVNIQYSIDIDELPIEVDRLVKDAQQRLLQLSTTPFSDNESSEISIQSLSSINELREKIVSVDYILSDIANIMSGYINYLTSAPEEEQQAPGPIEQNGHELYPATEVTNKLDELESKLQQFKSNNNQDNYDSITTQKSEFTQEVPKTTT